MAKKQNPLWWVKLSDKEILNLRFCDLNLSLRKSRLTPLIKKLYKELSEKNLKFRPHFWIADEWYSADGIPGIAIPFYLVHDRLIELHKNIMLEAEGEDPTDCMKLLRHEAGHAIDNAFHLRKSRGRQKLFGLSSTPYPENYRPIADCKHFVAHLNPWYTQAHPDEDWAETFALWLTPNSKWKSTYKDWPMALEKLNFVDQIMGQIKGKRAKVFRRERVGQIDKTTKKIKTFYNDKIEALESKKSFYLDPILKFLFSNDSKYKKNKLASDFINKNRGLVIEAVAKWTGQDQYVVDLILQDLFESCVQKKLHLKFSEKKSGAELIALLTAYTFNSFYSQYHGIQM